MSDELKIPLSFPSIYIDGCLDFLHQLDGQKSGKAARARGESGRRVGLKIRCPKGRAGSSPAERITPARRAYLNRYNLQWQRERRRAWLAANGPCRQCGSTHRLEVDHIDPATKVSHAVWSWSAVRREAELAKCQVLCHRCHKAKSDAAHRKPLVHGTINAYNMKGCRCDVCRAGHRERATEKRRRAGIPQRSPSR